MDQSGGKSGENGCEGGGGSIVEKVKTHLLLTKCFIQRCINYGHNRRKKLKITRHFVDLSFESNPDTQLCHEIMQNQFLNCQ